MSNTRAGEKNRNVFNIVLVGDAAAGKTTLVNRLVNSKAFSENYQATMGVEVQTINYPDGTHVLCWDTAGQERNQSLGLAYYKNIDLIVCVIDITRKKSLDNLNAHIDEALTYANMFSPNSYLPVFVVVTKTDLQHLAQFDMNSVHNKLMERTDATMIEGILFVNNGNDTDTTFVRDTLHARLKNSVVQQNSQPIIQPSGRVLYLENVTNLLNKANNPTLSAEYQKYFEQVETLRGTKLYGYTAECDGAVKDAIETFCNKYTSQKNKEDALKQLHKAASSLPNVKRLKAIGICMMAIGAILTVVGALTIAVSLGAITTGFLAPLGVLTAGGGIGMMAGGAACASIGMGLFATRHKIRNPLDSIKKIENLLN